MPWTAGFCATDDKYFIGILDSERCAKEGFPNLSNKRLIGGDRQLTTHQRHSAMDLGFPIAVIGKLTLSTRCRRRTKAIKLFKLK